MAFSSPFQRPFPATFDRRAAAAGPIVLFYDTFTDTNGVRLAAHTPSIGTAWTELGGSWAISSNAAVPTADVSGAGEAYWVAHANATKADCVITCTVTCSNTGSAYGIGVAVRVSDINNMFLVRYHRRLTPALQIIKLEGNVGSLLAQNTSVPNDANPHTLVITLAGSSISCVMDGTISVSTTSAFNQSAALHGLASRDSVYKPHDDFSIVG